MPCINCRLYHFTDTGRFVSFSFFLLLLLPCYFVHTIFIFLFFCFVFLFACFDRSSMVVLHTVNNFVVHLNHINAILCCVLWCCCCCLLFSRSAHTNTHTCYSIAESAVQSNAIHISVSIYVVNNVPAVYQMNKKLFPTVYVCIYFRTAMRILLSDDASRSFRLFLFLLSCSPRSLCSALSMRYATTYNTHSVCVCAVHRIRKYV